MLLGGTTDKKCDFGNKTDQSAISLTAMLK